MISLLTETFNTRESAFAIIIFLLISFALYKGHKEILESFSLLLKSFFNPKIIIPITIMVFYSLGIVYVLNIFGLWENHQIKNFIYWLIAVGFLTHFKADTYSVRDIIKKSISLIVIFQFIINFYTFNIFFELLLISSFLILSAMKAVSEKDENKEILHKTIDIILVTFIIILIVLSVNQYLTNINEFTKIKTLYDFIVPTILSIMIIPYFYIFFTLVSYENGFSRLSFAINNNKKLLRYAKLKGILNFNFDGKSFEKWSNNLSSYEINKDNLSESISDIKKLNRIRANINTSNIKKGWHPFLSNNFLKNYDIKIEDYRRMYGGNWCGTSNYHRISTEFSNIHYRIEGKLEYVTKLEIQLFFFRKEEENIEESYKLFINMCNELTFKTTEHDLSNKELYSLTSNYDISINYHGKRIIVNHQPFDTGAYQVTFIISAL